MDLDDPVPYVRPVAAGLAGVIREGSGLVLRRCLQETESIAELEHGDDAADAAPGADHDQCPSVLAQVISGVQDGPQTGDVDEGERAHVEDDAFGGADHVSEAMLQPGRRSEVELTLQLDQDLVVPSDVADLERGATQQPPHRSLWPFHPIVHRHRRP
jgi:hypothetical protein